MTTSRKLEMQGKWGFSTTSRSKHPKKLESRPKVTIGLCVKDSVSTVCNAIDSIVAQEFPHELMESIFVDDGSQDGTLSILRGYATKMDMNVRIFHHQWRGLGYSRNVVVDNACGDYIIWVDGDIAIPKDYVGKFVDFMETNSKTGIAGGVYRGISTNLVSMLENVIFEVADSQSIGMLVSGLPGTGASIFRVEAVRGVGGFDENIKGAGEDMDVAYRIRAKGWLLYRLNNTYYAGSSETWRLLWEKYFWHGWGIPYLVQKNAGILSLYKMTPFAMLYLGLVYSVKAYKIRHQMILFLLPFHSLFKSIAFWVGLMSALYRQSNDKKTRLS